MVLKVNAGLFFRAEGGVAAAFGSKQGEGLPNITGEISSVFTKYDVSLNVSGAFSANGAWTGGHENGTNMRATSISFSANRANAIYGANSHVTPVNSTIRVWKRTA